MARSARLSATDPSKEGRRRRIAPNIEIGVGGILLTAALVLAFGGPYAAQTDPTELVAAPALGPSAEYPLGTDALGRDVLSRLLNGGRSIILLSLAAVTIAFATGGTAGMVMALRGGRLDRYGSVVVDVLLGVPALLVALVVFSGLGTSPLLIVLTVGFVFGPRVARVLRGATQSIVNQEYVQAAQLRGEGVFSIVGRELAPNIAAPLLVEFALRLTYIILFVAALNFLGLGVQPPNPDWGVMASENSGIITVNPWATLAPAFAIAILSMGVSFLADGLTQVLGLPQESFALERKESRVVRAADVTPEGEEVPR